MRKERKANQEKKKKKKKLISMRENQNSTIKNPQLTYLNLQNVLFTGSQHRRSEQSVMKEIFVL
jgi:hypothetical protein